MFTSLKKQTGEGRSVFFPDEHVKAYCNTF